MLKIKSFREEKHLSQTQLAKKIGIHPSYINKIEAGLKEPSLKVLYAIADSLEVCRRDLIDCNCPKCSKEKSSAG